MKKGLLLLAALVCLAAYFYVANLLFGGVCPSKIIAGLPCPGCGLTRAALLILRGDFVGSLRMNPILPFLFIYAILVLRKKTKIAQNYIIFVIILSFAVFGYRVIFSFGTEPVVYNPHNLTSFIISSLQNTQEINPY